MPGGKTHLAIGLGVGLALSGMLPVSTSFPWQLALTVSITTISALAPDLDIADNELEELGRNEGQRLARTVRRAGRKQGCFWSLATNGIGGLLWLVGETISRMVEGLAWLVQRWTTHRGMTHSLIIALYMIVGSISLSVLLTPSRTLWWGAAWSAGWLSHLAADALTLSGLKLLQPWSQRRFWLVPRPLRFRVGTLPDSLLGAVAPMIGLSAFLLGHGLLNALAAALGG